MKGQTETYRANGKAQGWLETNERSKTTVGSKGSQLTESKAMIMEMKETLEAEPATKKNTIPQNISEVSQEAGKETTEQKRGRKTLEHDNSNKLIATCTGLVALDPCKQSISNKNPSFHLKRGYNKHLKRSCKCITFLGGGSVVDSTRICFLINVLYCLYHHRFS